MNGYVIALDQGTTSSRAIVFDRSGSIHAKAQYPLPQHYPQPGWVEHDPMEILSTQILALSEVFEKSGLSPTDIAAIGITNQRETTILWDKTTGKPVSNAIVWQCRRTAPLCEQLAADGMTDYIRDRTGLLIDPYFSGTKIRWLLDHVDGARELADQGRLLFGNVETWLIWNLTGGAVHVTDYTNASRTMLFDIDRLCWDEMICKALDIPMQILPQPVGNSQVYGHIAPGLKGLQNLAGVPISGAAGDQQAALFGQACFQAGQAKNTYGTGCFTLMNTGSRRVKSQNGLVSAVAWNLGGETTYALEGSAFNAGSAIQWLRDSLDLIHSAPECDVLAETVGSAEGVYFVPAFTGLGAPYWDAYARGSFFGLTRGSTKAHLCRAVLESIAYEVTDLVRTMALDAGSPISSLRVDGGASVSDVMMQFQADMLAIPVDRPAMVETTAVGAAYLAGLAVGLWSDLTEIESSRQVERVFTTNMDAQQREEQYRRWQVAVELARKWGEMS
jgi:glycerol kinase